MRRAFYARARVWHRLEKWDMAIDDYDAVIELAPEASCYSNRGKIWLFIGEVERAIRDFDAALNLCPWSTQAYTARAAAYQRQGKIESALADLEEAIRYEPNDSNVYIARAQLFVTLRDFERALQDCDKAISLGDDHRLYLNRAHIHVLKGALDKALSDLDTAIEREPQFVQAWIGLSSVFLMIHDWEKAGDAADEAIRLDPKQAAAYSNRSSAWGGKKQYAKVIEDATQAILLGVRKGSGVVKTLCHFDSRPPLFSGRTAVYDLHPVPQSAEIHVQVGRYGLGAVHRRGLDGRQPQFMRDSPAAPADLPPPFKPSPGFRQAVHLRASSHRPSSSKVEVGTNAFFPDAPKDSYTLAETTLP